MAESERAQSRRAEKEIVARDSHWVEQVTALENEVENEVENSQEKIRHWN